MYAKRENFRDQSFVQTLSEDSECLETALESPKCENQWTKSQREGKGYQRLP